MRAQTLIVALMLATTARAELPRPVGQAFVDAHVPLQSVSLVVQEVGAARPLFVHDPTRPMNPASVMKLVTTFAALELLGRDYRWKTEAYLDGPLDGGVLHGDLVLKGYGDPKITIEQWQSFMAAMRAKGLDRVEGNLALDRTWFKPAVHDAAAFDHEPLKPYNVGPDALLVNFKSIRFVFAPNAGGDAVDLRVEPALPQVVVTVPPVLIAAGDCADWRGALGANFLNSGASAKAAFAGRFAQACGERDWYVALLDHPHFVHGMFTTYFRDAGGQFDGGLKEARAPRGTVPFVTLESPPLYDIVRDVNKLSNNVMARQIFLTLATTRYPPPATPALAADVVQRFLKERKIAIPGLVIENGSGLSRNERVTAGGLAQLLAAADRSAAREEFASSLSVAATDGTLQKRFQTGNVGGQALLKTGTLDGVKALAGYVIDAQSRRWIVVAIINHPDAARGQTALDALVQWVYRAAGTWDAKAAR